MKLTNFREENIKKLLSIIPSRYSIKWIDQNNLEVNLNNNSTIHIELTYATTFIVKLNDKKYEYRFIDNDLNEAKNNFKSLLDSFFDYKLYMNDLNNDDNYVCICDGYKTYFKNKETGKIICMIPHFIFDNAEPVTISIYGTCRIPYEFSINESPTKIKEVVRFFLDK